MTAHELYERIVGEGGCSPDYFLNHMSVSESLCYLAGQDRRHRQNWEQTRLLTGTIVKVLTGEDLDLPFPWDESHQEETTPEELEQLRARARKLEQRMNGGGNL